MHNPWWQNMDEMLLENIFLCNSINIIFNNIDKQLYNIDNIIDRVRSA